MSPQRKSRRRDRRLHPAPGASRRTKNHLKRPDIEIMRYRGDWLLIGQWWENRLRPVAWLRANEVLVNNGKDGW